MKNIGSYIILLLLLSCKRETSFYEYLIIQNDAIKLWTNPILVEWKEDFENGDWIVKASNGDTVVYGKFKDGFRDGNWSYQPTDSQRIEINWNKYRNQLVEINLPFDWRTHESNERPFQATFPNEKGDDKYFIILSYNEDSVKLTLDEYWKLYNDKIFHTESVKSYVQYKFSQQTDTFYYSEYTVVRDDTERLIFNFLGVLNGEIYDITFSSSDVNETKKTIIFFEMVRSLIIKGQRFFSPYKKVNGMKELRFTASDSTKVIS